MSFIGYFFLLVVALGLAELSFLVQVASELGFFPTLGLCILTGVVGGALVRAQGLVTLRRIQSHVAAGEVPTVEIISGVVLLLTGALLIMPGFITDALGLLLLVPAVRRGVARRIGRAIERRVTLFGPHGQTGARSFFDGPVRPAGGRGRGRVIDIGPDDDPSGPAPS